MACRILSCQKCQMRTNSTVLMSASAKKVMPSAYLPDFSQGSAVCASTRPGGLSGSRGMKMRLSSRDDSGAKALESALSDDSILWLFWASSGGLERRLGAKVDHRVVMWWNIKLPW